MDHRWSNLFFGTKNFFHCEKSILEFLSFVDVSRTI